jgi:hypothetical protein
MVVFVFVFSIVKIMILLLGELKGHRIGLMVTLAWEEKKLIEDGCRTKGEKLRVSWQDSFIIRFISIKGLGKRMTALWRACRSSI